MAHIFAPPGATPTWPYSLSDMKRDNPQVSFPANLAAYDTTAHHVYPVQPVEPPQQTGMVAVEVQPVLVGGVWTQQWELQPEPPAPVPDSVSMAQARLALLDAGLLDQVDAALAAIPDPIERRAAQVRWDYETRVRYDDQLVRDLKSAFGLTSQQFDELFRLAATK